MLTLLGTVFGLVGSFLPHLLDYFKTKLDYLHEIDMFKLQLENTRLLGQIQLAEIEALADVAQMENVYKPMQLTNIKWVDAVSVTVRPFLTYAFFLLYAGVKVANFTVLYWAGQDTTWAEALQAVWHQEDWAMFAAVISYWFSMRTLQKLWKK